MYHVAIAVVLVHFVASLSALHASAAMAQADALQSLVDSYYNPLIDRFPWGGVAVGIVTLATNQSFFYSYGHENGTTDSSRVSADTVFSINSMTKVFTGITLADFVRRGACKLDDKIQPYIPDERMPVDQGREIRFEDLATHWSGLPTRPDNFPNPDEPYAGYTDEMFFDFIGNYTFDELHLRRQYYYSNAAFGLLAYTLADEIGRSSFRATMNDLFFGPLGMSASGLVVDSKDVPHLATGHLSNGSIVAFGESSEAVLGSWAVRSTARDMVTFLVANMQAEAQLSSKRGESEPSTTVSPSLNLKLSPELAEAMQMAQVPRRPTDEERFRIGLGWRTETATNTHLKSGSGDGFEANMLFNTERGVAVVVLCNTYVEQFPDISTTSSALFAQVVERFGKPLK